MDGVVRKKFLFFGSFRAAPVLRTLQPSFIDCLNCADYDRPANDARCTSCLPFRGDYFGQAARTQKLPTIPTIFLFGLAGPGRYIDWNWFSRSRTDPSRRGRRAVCLSLKGGTRYDERLNRRTAAGSTPTRSEIRPRTPHFSKSDHAASPRAAISAGTLNHGPKTSTSPLLRDAYGAADRRA